MRHPPQTGVSGGVQQPGPRVGISRQARRRIAQFRQAIRVDPRFLKPPPEPEAALDKAGRNQEAQDTRRRAAELESASPSP